MNFELVFSVPCTLNHLLTNSLKPGSPLGFVSPHYYRPTEVDLLIGEPSKAKACPPCCLAGKIGMGSRNRFRKISEVDGGIGDHMINY